MTLDLIKQRLDQLCRFEGDHRWRDDWRPGGEIWTTKELADAILAAIAQADPG